MKSLKTTDFLKGKSDSGAALALVLLMVIFLSLWLSSVFLVSASSKKAIDTNIAQAQLKDNNIDAALQSALSVINGQSLGSTAPGYNGSCTGASMNYTAPDGTVIQVSCTQANNSGVVGPIASFVLTGTNASCGASCVTGVDGGLNIISSSTANLCQAISKLKFSGGIFNSSGAFQNVNACTVQMDIPAGVTLPVVTTPSTTQSGFPASNTPPTQITNGSTQTVQPARLLVGSTTSSTSPDVNPVSSTDPSAKNNVIYDYLRSESQSLAKDGDKTNSLNLAQISYNSANGGAKADTWDARATGACSVNTYSDGKIYISPSKTKSGFGRISSSMLQRLNTLSAGCSGSPAKIVFTPGSYRFEADPTSTDKTTYEWLIQGGTTVIGGAPNASSNDCDTTQSGVQLQFRNSFLTIGKAHVYLCQQNEANSTHHAPVISAPRTGDGAEFGWNNTSGRKNSNGDDAFFTVLDYKTSTSGHDHEYNYLTSTEKSFNDQDGSDSDGKFSTWSSNEQNNYASSLKKTVAQLTSDDKLKGEAKRGVNDKLLNDSDAHYTVKSCMVCFNAHGSILAPASWAHTYENSLVKWVVDNGMNFRAMTIHLDNEAGNVSRAEAGRASGDRVVQLTFKAKTKGSTTWKPLGNETVQIMDYQGRHPGSGYKLLSRNLVTNTNG